MVLFYCTGGYRREQKQSAVAIKWMKWLEQSEGWRIKHKLTGGEEKVPGTNFRVDGFIDRSATNQRPLALEFHGLVYLHLFYERNFISAAAGMGVQNVIWTARKSFPMA